MFTRLSRILSTCILGSGIALGFATPASAVEFSENKYDIYRGDINQDGVDDLYFHGKEQFILLHGEVATPIIVSPQASYQINGESVNGESAFSSTNTLVDPQLTQQQITDLGLTLLSSGSDFFLGDFNNDNISDVLIRAEGFEAAYIYTGSTGNNAPAHLIEYSGEHAALINDRTTQLVLRDANADGRIDIVFVSSDPQLADQAILGGGDYLAIEYVTDDVNALPIAFVGATNGEFRVSESGAASYMIDIALPKGIADVVPEVSLDYSSQAGNGLLGEGWSLNTNTSITRCRQTLAINDVAKPITLNAEDRFCMNGQQLILVNGSQYGAVNAEYKTEIDTYMHIYSVGGVLGDPDSFEVVSKDGSLKVYGGNAGSSFDLGEATHTWSLTSAEDNVGNAIDYIYEGGAIDHRIKEIRYANDAARITFHYDNTRPDARRYFIAGHKVEMNVRLNRIDVHNDGQLLRSYQLTYLKATTESRASRLYRIQECANIGQDCLPAQEFTWQIQSVDVHDSASAWLPIQSGDDISLIDYKLADINGDGCQDLVMGFFDRSALEYKTRISKSINNCTSYEIPVNIITRAFSEEATHYQLNVLDYNADGRQDVALRYSEATSWELHLSSPSGDGVWDIQSESIPLPSYINRQFFIDINSDGLVDNVGGNRGVHNGHPLEFNRNLAYILKRTVAPGSSSSTPYNFSNTETKNLGVDEAISYGDFNGDGNIDLITFNHSRESDEGSGAQCAGGTSVCAATYVETREDIEIYVQTSSGASRMHGWTSFNRECFFGASNCSPTGQQPKLEEVAFIADFNGDGLDDVVLQRGNIFELYLSTGVGFIESPISLPVTPLQLRSDLPPPASWSFAERQGHENALPVPQSIDYNRDGMLDIYWHDKIANQIQVSLWDGASESFGVPFSVFEAPDDYDVYGFVDLNGDGGNDLFRLDQGPLNTQSKFLEIYNNVDGNTVNNVITHFDNSFGRVVAVDYGRMNTSAHYFRLDVAGNVDGVDHTTCERDANFQPEFGDANRVICETTHVANTDELYNKLNNPFGLDETSPDFGRPVFDVNSTLPIVTRVEQSAPIPGNKNATNKVDYLYTEAKMQAGGRGFLGFKTLTSIDIQTGIKTTTEYRQNFPFIGLPERTIVKTPEDEILSDALNRYEDVSLDDTSYVQPQLVFSDEKSYPSTTDATQGDGLSVGLDALTTTVTYNSYDADGNITITQTTTTGDFDDPDIEGGTQSLIQTRFVFNSYGQNADTLSLHGRSFTYSEMGRLTRVRATGTRNGVAQEQRISDFTYYSNGLLHEEIIEPESTLLSEKLTTTHTYDRFGNEIKTELEGWNGYLIETREQESAYDESGRYMTQSKDAYGHVLQTIQERDRYGARKVVHDANGLTSLINYDHLGREVSTEDNADENRTTISYLSCSVACPAHAQYAMRYDVQHGASRIEYMDSLGRTVRLSRQDFNGSWTHVDTEYDVIGRVLRISEPYYFTPEYWRETDYDILNRPVVISAPAFNSVQSFSSIAYSGLTATTTNHLGQSKRETKNVFGELIKIEDLPYRNSGDYAYVRYTYDTEGNLTHTTVHPSEGGEIDTEIHYDRLHRKDWMNDPDKGRWEYEYNAFGELIRQVDAKGQVVRNRYDLLGRLFSRTDYTTTAESQVENHTRWYFDGATDDASTTISNAIGQVSAVVMTQNSNQQTCASGAAQYCSYPSFDSFGRPTSTAMHINTDNDNSTPLEVFNSSVTYDIAGRVEETHDVLSGLVQDENGDAISSGVRNVYNSLGYVEHLEDIHSGDVLYRTRQTNARGQVTHADVGPYGRRLYFDEGSGLLQKQVAYVGGLASLNDSPDALTIQHITYDWDAIGNLLSRHNQSSLRNSGSNSGNRNLLESFCYDGLNRLIKTRLAASSLSACHTLTEAEQDLRYDSVGNITYKRNVGDYVYHATKKHAVISTGDGTQYTYDNNGNMRSDTSGRSLIYSTFDKPTEITKGNHTSRFAYGPDRARYLQIDSNAAVADKNKTTVYLGGVERIAHNDGTIEWRREVQGGIRTYTTDASFQMIGDEEKRIVFKDHLGSVDVIGDTFGNLEQSMSFDPWGARRHENSSLSLLTTSELFSFNDSITNRGFTSHEMLDELGLIHMNGRIYDAKIARFMQADPFVQAGTDTQMFNRYSYLRNNPLNATDPSGYFRLRSWVGLIVAVVGGAICGPACAKVGWQAAALGAVSGAAGAIANGGNILYGAALGAVSGLAFAGAGGIDSPLGQFAWRSLLGGVFSVIQGGKFGHGFASAGFSGIAGNDLIPRVIVGGTISKLTGGKFASGAGAAAFSWAVSERGGEWLKDRLCLLCEPDFKTLNLDPKLNKSLKDNIEFNEVKSKSGKLRYVEVKIKGTVAAQSIGDAKEYSPEQFIKDVNKHFKGSLKIDKVKYKFVSELTTLSPGDSIHDADFVYTTSERGSSAVRGESGSLSPINLDVAKMRSSTPLHEMLHQFGVGHFNNSTKDIMSYSDKRKMSKSSRTLKDLKELYDN